MVVNSMINFFFYPFSLFPYHFRGCTNSLGPKTVGLYIGLHRFVDRRGVART